MYSVCDERRYGGTNIVGDDGSMQFPFDLIRKSVVTHILANLAEAIIAKSASVKRHTPSAKVYEETVDLASSIVSDRPTCLFEMSWRCEWSRQHSE